MGVMKRRKEMMKGMMRRMRVKRRIMWLKLRRMRMRRKMVNNQLCGCVVLLVCRLYQQHIMKSG
jgi:hypothetical protein